MRVKIDDRSRAPAWRNDMRKGPGARPMLWALHACFPDGRLVWADSGYAGRLVGWATDQLHLTLQNVTKLTGQTTSSCRTAGGRSSGRFPGSTAAGAPSGTMSADLSITPRWSNGHDHHLDPPTGPPPTP